MSRNNNLRKCMLGVASIVQLIAGFGCSIAIGKCGGTPPESQLLKMQRFYSREPPHDIQLYNTLRVLSNATASDITKAYRLRSRELHPDKRSHFSNSQLDMIENASAVEANDLDEELERVRQAYDILKDDRTRRLYHKYGLLDTSMAAMILTGGFLSAPKSTSVSYSDRWNTLTPEHQRLLKLMGYHDYLQKDNYCSQNHEQRVIFIATNLVELLRPLVEGLISQQDFAHQISSECQSLKSLPLGAQIIRCIGRAYRRSGQRYLKRHQRYHRSTNKNRRYPKTFDVVSLDVTDGIRDTLRNVQHIATAAVASGKLILKQQQNSFRNQVNKIKKTLPSIAYYNDIDADDEQFLADIFGDDVNYESGSTQSKSIRQEEHDNAEGAIISTLQVEALWKISKIELDRTIQEACDVILRRKYFFFPNHYQRQMHTYKSKHASGAFHSISDPQVDHKSDGWVVSSTGKVIETDTGKLRAAAALVLVGDILVQCSKEGTSWR